jgi:hypothetical protein
MRIVANPFRNQGCLLLILVILAMHISRDGGIGASAPAALAATSCPDTLTIGQAIECSITAAGETDAYPFAAAAGDRIKALIVRQLDSIDPSIRIMDPAGKQVCAAFNSDQLAEIGGCILSSTGTHTLLVEDTYRVKTGNYIIYSQRLNNPVNPRPLSAGQALIGTITGLAEFNTFSFEGVISSTISLQAIRTSGTLRPRIRVYAPTGFVVCNAFSGGATVEVTDCVLPRAGTYTILVDDAYQGNTGDYTITLNCPTERCDPLSYYIPLIAKQ